MKFLLLTNTYYPEKKSASFMLQELSELIVSKGHSIEVITFAEWTKNKYEKEVLNGVTIHRLKIPKANGSRLKRALIELSFSLRIKIFLKKTNLSNKEVLISYSPSIFFGKAVKYLKKKWNAKSYLILRDLFPDWAVNVGLMKKGLIYKFFKHYEKIMIKNSDFIGVESKKDISHCKNISSIPKVHHLLNWFGKSEKFDSTQSNYINENKINLIYGGVLGEAQDIISFLKKIESFEDFDKKFRFIIIGNGDQELKIKKHARNSKLDIVLSESMERKDYMNLLSQSQAGLIVLNNKLNSNNYPGKAFDYMFHSKPIFAFMNKHNEFGELIEKEDIGYYSYSKETLLTQFDLLFTEKEIMREKGTRGNNLFKKKFVVENAYEKIFEVI